MTAPTADPEQIGRRHKDLFVMDDPSGLPQGYTRAAIFSTAANRLRALNVWHQSAVVCEDRIWYPHVLAIAGKVVRESDGSQFLSQDPQTEMIAGTTDWQVWDQARALGLSLEGPLLVGGAVAPFFIHFTPSIVAGDTGKRELYLNGNGAGYPSSPVTAGLQVSRANPWRTDPIILFSSINDDGVNDERGVWHVVWEYRPGGRVGDLT